MASQLNRRRLTAVFGTAVAAVAGGCMLPGQASDTPRGTPRETVVALSNAPAVTPTPPTAQAPTPTTQPTPEPTPVPRLPVFYSPQYVIAGFAYETTRKARWVADSLEREPIPWLVLETPSPLEETEVAAVHDPVYVQAVRTGQPRTLAESQGFTWDAKLYSAVLASNGGAVAAAIAALRSGSGRKDASGNGHTIRAAGSLSSGLHHAHRQYGLGNCTFNGLALATRAALAAGARNVLIVDLDAHCGGGTNELVGSDAHVWHVDVAVHTFDRYQPAPRQTLDVVQAARAYLPMVQRRLEQLPGRAPAFDLCIYNAGMDPFERCPVGGLPGITREVLDARERLVFAWCRAHGIPIAFVLAGGYLGPGLDEAGLAGLHRLTLQAAATV